MITDETSLNAALSLADCFIMVIHCTLEKKPWQVSSASKLRLKAFLCSPQPLNLQKTEWIEGAQETEVILVSKGNSYKSETLKTQTPSGLVTDRAHRGTNKGGDNISTETP